MKNLSRFLIYVNRMKDIDDTFTNKLVKMITDRGGAASVAYGDQDTEGGSVKSELISDKEAVIVLGGDGTMLRAAHVTSGYALPLTGINLGTVGFLAETDFSRAEELVDRLMAGDYDIKERMVLRGDIIKGAGQDGEESIFESHTAINDIVICRDGKLRIIAVKIYLNGQYLETYKADGVIISTPTGSTAYNLSAGGPLVSPNARNLILTPIAPHSLTGKSFVFADTDKVSIEVVEKSETEEPKALVSYDGYVDVHISESCRCEISTTDEKVRFISISNRNFYDVLRSKMLK